MRQTHNCLLLGYHDKLKRIYINGKLQDIYIGYLNRIFEDGILNRLIQKRLREDCLKKSNMRLTMYEKTIHTTHCGGFYPKYLEYNTPYIKETILYMNQLPIHICLHVIKKELLRKIFLFTFENFLNTRKYGIDFRAYYRIPVNSIQFTTEYQNSGKLYRDFFNNSRSQTK